MTTIAITAGGTSEDIDGVRKITNISTGSLGWNCLEALFEYMQQTNQTDFQVYYIHTTTAIRKVLTPKQQSHVEFIEVSDVESVYNAVNTLTQTKQVDYFIHSMAISDFTYSYSVGITSLAEELFQLMESDNKTSLQEIRDVLTNPKSKLCNDTKISSSEDLLMGLTTTPKVIPLIKGNNPNTFLVGFKLLRAVSSAELIAEAERLAQRNDCDMVFANEASRISENNHTGLLIKNGEIIEKPSGKKEIAKSIIYNMCKGK